MVLLIFVKNNEDVDIISIVGVLVNCTILKVIVSVNANLNVNLLL